MKTAATWIYGATAPLCLAAPFLRDESLRTLLLTYVAAPLFVMSLVLSLAAWLVGSKSRLDVAIAAIWALAAVSMCVPLSAEPGNLERLFVAVEVQAALVGAGALGLLIHAVRAIRGDAPLSLRALHSGGLGVLALLLARRSLTTWASLSVSESQGLAGIAAEISLFWRVVVACAAAVALAVVAMRASRGRARRAELAETRDRAVGSPLHGK